jgi:hypothetical protein
LTALSVNQPAAKSTTFHHTQEKLHRLIINKLSSLPSVYLLLSSWYLPDVEKRS